jgi:hypothetical protein
MPGATTSGSIGIAPSPEQRARSIDGRGRGAILAL